MEVVVIILHYLLLLLTYQIALFLGNKGWVQADVNKPKVKIS